VPAGNSIYVGLVNAQNVEYSINQQWVFIRRDNSTKCTYKMSTAADVAEVDRWISMLMECKQLPELDVKKLCDKVILTLP
jgi:hypothetical protein